MCVVVTHLALCGINTPFPEINLCWIFFSSAASSLMLVLLPLSSFMYNPPVQKQTGQVKWLCYSGRAPPRQGGSASALPSLQQPLPLLTPGCTWREDTCTAVHMGPWTLPWTFVWEMEDRLQPSPVTCGSSMFEENCHSQGSVQKGFFKPLFFTSLASYGRTLASLFVTTFCLHFENTTICVPTTGVALFHNN